MSDKIDPPPAFAADSGAADSRGGQPVANVGAVAADAADTTPDSATTPGASGATTLAAAAAAAANVASAAPAPAPAPAPSAGSAAAAPAPAPATTGGARRNQETPEEATAKLRRMREDCKIRGIQQALLDPRPARKRERNRKRRMRAARLNERKALEAAAAATAAASAISVSGGAVSAGQIAGGGPPGLGSSFELPIHRGPPRRFCRRCGAPFPGARGCQQADDAHDFST